MIMNDIYDIIDCLTVGKYIPKKQKTDLEKHQNSLDVTQYKDLINTIENLISSAKYTVKLRTQMESYKSLMETNNVDGK